MYIINQDSISEVLEKPELYDCADDIAIVKLWILIRDTILFMYKTNDYCIQFLLRQWLKYIWHSSHNIFTDRFNKIHDAFNCMCCALNYNISR